MTPNIILKRTIWDFLASPRSKDGSKDEDEDGSKKIHDFGNLEGQLDPAEIEICKTADGRDWLLGAGSFGHVYKGLRRGVQEVAVKKLASHLAGDVWMDILVKEINVLKMVSFDRNVVQYYGACLQDQASAMLVMEYMAVCLPPPPPSYPCTAFCRRFIMECHGGGLR